MPLMTGKQALMEMLRAEGVRHVFGNPGTSESAIMSCLPAYPDIRYVLVTQEGVAMGMADGYSSASGAPSLVNLHIETGLANGISLLHHAMDGGVPLVLTAGNKDIRKYNEGRSDLVEMVRQFTKWSGRSDSCGADAGNGATGVPRGQDTANRPDVCGLRRQCDGGLRRHGNSPFF